MLNKISVQYLQSRLDYCEDSGIFTWKFSPSRRIKIGDIAGSESGHGYIKIGIDGTKYYAHRLAWFYVNGIWPLGRIDHRNGNRANNSYKNLRQATHEQNCMNRPARGTRLHGGGKWTAQIGVNSKQIYLGCFSTEIEAHNAYINAVLKIHGESWANRKVS